MPHPTHNRTVTYAEIASAVGLPESTVRGWWRRPGGMPIQGRRVGRSMHFPHDEARAFVLAQCGIDIDAAARNPDLRKRIDRVTTMMLHGLSELQELRNEMLGEA